MFFHKPIVEVSPDNPFLTPTSIADEILLSQLEVIM